MGIAAIGGHRGHWSLDWRIKTAIYSASSALGGAIVGLAFGLLGSAVSEQPRGAIILLVSVALACLGAYEAFGHRAWLPQIDRETSERWLFLGPIGWAVLNGLALGAGALSRIGFALWYMLPLAAFASGSAITGMVLIGTYGLLRAGAVVPWFLAMASRKQDSDQIAEALFELKPIGHVVGGLLLFMLSVVAAATAL